MAQRILCRFCETYFKFDSAEAYEEAKAQYEAHLEGHSEVGDLPNREDLCEICQANKLIEHCPGNLQCEWLVCTRCKVIWGPNQAVSYRDAYDERKKNGV